MSNFVQEIRYAGRMLAKTPAATLVAVVTLALGIGANTAIFSVVYAAMFRPLPFGEPDRLMHIGIQWKSGYINDNLTPALADAIIRQNHSFSSVLVDFPATGCNLTGGGTPEYVPDRRVSTNFFSTLGVAPFLGRDFVAADAVQSNAAILSYRLWRENFAGDREVLGKQLWCNGVAYTIVGVLPQNFRMNKPYDVWLPDRLARYSTGGGMNHLVIARLKPGVTKQAAAADLADILHQYQQENPKNWVSKATALAPRSYREWNSSQLKTPLWLLFGAVLVVLLIACANVTGLLLARSAARRREMAVRVALGARRWDVIRQMLTETMLLNLTGAALGVLLAWWSLGSLKTILPSRGGYYSISDFDFSLVAINVPVLLFTLGVALIAAFISGLAPALGAIARDVYGTLKSGERGGGFTRAQQRSRKLLLGGEVALAVVLLACAVLLVRSFAALEAVDLGFQPRHLQVAELSMASKKFATPAAVWDFDQKALQRIRALPGVVAAATVSSPPLEGGLNLGSPVVNGKQCSAGNDVYNYRAISPDVFRTMETRLLAGRDFTDADVAGSTPVAIVNATAARLCWSSGNAVGSQFVERDIADGPLQIVGVVEDVHDYSVDLPAPPIIYLPQAQASKDLNDMLYQSFGLISAIVIRTSGDQDLSVGVRRAIEDVDPQQPIVSVAPMSHLVAESTSFARMLMLLMASFAGLALLLTAIGLYGLLSYHVTQRTREIGVRMALGAGAGQVLSMVVREGVVLLLGGAVVGIGGAIAATRLLKSQIYGVSPGDPLTLLAAVAVLFLVGVLASYLPARRATRVHPMEALRYE
ncbi:MAG TPA: ABC transporter permease [Terriglobales bacterium]|nr:ABC transporter permease [Terriglobales bacterium]